jgi:predicted nucleotidyltransferase
MMMSTVLDNEIEARRPEIARICVDLGVRRLELFGSAVHGGPARDVDLLVDLGDRSPAEYATAFFALRARLEALFSRSVDLVTPAGLANPYFRARVEREKVLLYAA